MEAPVLGQHTGNAGYWFLEQGGSVATLISPMSPYEALARCHDCDITLLPLGSDGGSAFASFLDQKYALFADICATGQGLEMLTDKAAWVVSKLVTPVASPERGPGSPAGSLQFVRQCMQ